MKVNQADEQLKFLMELCDAQGVACTTTTDDGVLIVMSRSFLKDCIEKHPDKPKLVLFVKTTPQRKN